MYRLTLIFSITVFFNSILCTSCAESTSSDNSSTDADSDADSDTDADADSDADTDTDTDSDTDTDTDTGTGDEADSGPDTDTDTDTDAEGFLCGNPVVVPDTPSDFQYTSDWGNFPASVGSFNNSMPGCFSSAGGGVVWFQVSVPAGETLFMESPNNLLPYVAFNILDSCSASSCLDSSDSSFTYKNTGSTPVDLYVAVHQIFNTGYGSIELEFDRFEMHGDNCMEAIPMTSVTPSTAQTEIVVIDPYSQSAMPSGCGGSGKDVWFTVSVPPNTRVGFTPFCYGGSGTCSYGTTTDCSSGSCSPNHVDSSVTLSSAYVNNTTAPVDSYWYVQQDAATTGYYQVYMSMTDLPPGNSCGAANPISAAQLAAGYSWSNSSFLFYNSCTVCPGASGPDVWHEVTVPDGTVLTVQKTAGTYDTFIAAVSDCSASPTLLEYVLPPEPEVMVWENDTGSSQTIYVVAGAVSASGSMSNLQLDFSVHTPAAGDFCHYAIGVDDTDGNDTESESGTWSSYGDFFWGATGCLSADGPEVWFQMDIPPGELLSVIDYSADITAVHILNGCTGTCVASGAENSSYLNTTSSTETVWVVLEADAAIPTGSWDVTFDWTPPDLGDLCVSAIGSIDLSSGSDSYLDDWSSFSDTKTLAPSNGCTSADGQDIWFEVTVPADTKLTVTDNLAGSGPDLALHVVESCVSSPECNFSGPQKVSWYNEDTGSDADVIVAAKVISSTVSSGAIDLSFETFSPIPSGDACGTAYTATLPLNTVVDLAGHDPAWPHDPTCVTASGSDIWYELTVPDGNILFVEAAPIGSDDIVVLLSEACPTVSCAVSSDANGAGGMEDLDWNNNSGAPQTVWIAVKGKTAADNNGTAALSIHYQSANVGDVCSNAEFVDLTTSASATWSGNFSAFNDHFTGGAGCPSLGSPNPDVWFQVQVPADQWLLVSDSSGTPMNIQALDSCSVSGCASTGISAMSWKNADTLNPSSVFVVVESDGASAGSIDLVFSTSTAVFMEGFESIGSWPWSPWGGPLCNGTISSSAAHDGSQGVEDPDWCSVSLASFPFGSIPGQIVSIWGKPGPSGRIYTGFNGDTNGTRSFVIAANTNALIFQDSPGYTSFFDVADTYQFFPPVSVPWYRFEIEYDGGGMYTGRLYASDGATLLGSVTADYGSTSTAYGLSIRAFGSSYIDTVTFF